MQYKLLSNGINIPTLGYGTLHISPAVTEKCVLDALHVGYRLIDTAAVYGNEKEIGQAIKKSKIPREELFITSKVWVQDAGYENTLKAFDTSLNNLGLDYLDLYLIHHPLGDYYGSYKAMEELYKKGQVRSIGVCNFNKERFIDLYINSQIKPMINQIEFHPFFSQDDMKNFLDKYHCQVEAWGPFDEGQRDIFNNPILQEVAKKHQKTVAQIILRWHIQKEIITIPKTIHKDRMIENMDIWNFVLEDNDIEKISKLNIGHSEIIDYQCCATIKLNKYKIHD